MDEINHHRQLQTYLCLSDSWLDELIIAVVSNAITLIKNWSKISGISIANIS